MSECVRTRKIINGMFKHYSPQNVDLAEASTRAHLEKCLECRLYLKEMLEKKKEEVEK